MCNNRMLNRPQTFEDIVLNEYCGERKNCLASNLFFEKGFIITYHISWKMGSRGRSKKSMMDRDLVLLQRRSIVYHIVIKVFKHLDQMMWGDPKVIALARNWCRHYFIFKIYKGPWIQLVSATRGSWLFLEGGSKFHGGFHTQFARRLS